MGYTVAYSFELSKEQVREASEKLGYKVGSRAQMQRWCPTIEGSPLEAIEAAKLILLPEYGESLLEDSISVTPEDWAAKPIPRTTGTWFNKKNLGRGLKSVMVGNRYELQPV